MISCVAWLHVQIAQQNTWSTYQYFKSQICYQMNFFLFCFFQTLKCSFGTKPCLLFSGQEFENDAVYKRLKNILIGRCE